MSKYIYHGFTGSISGGPDVYTTATSEDGVAFTGAGGTWSTPPYGVNAPSAIYFQGNWYVHVAQASDGGAGSDVAKWYLGKIGANPSGAVTNIATIDWTGYFGSGNLFAGNFFVDDDGSVHLTIPCTAVGSPYASGWGCYETHAVTTSGGSTPVSNATPGATLQYWSPPVQISGPLALSYDHSIVKCGSTYVMVMTQFFTTGSNEFGAPGTNWSQGPIQFATASSLMGPYTMITSGDWAGWKSSVGLHEGPNLLRIPGGWRLYLERLSTAAHNGNPFDNQLFYADFASPDLSQAANTSLWSTPVAITQDQVYRHGSVRAVPLSAASGLLA